ncbi:MAG: plasmid recombination protein [Anaerotignum sp.]|nr:plasmid recombination protein [Anaerotignum sp.]
MGCSEGVTLWQDKRAEQVVEDCLQSAISCMADQKYDSSGRSEIMASVEKFTHGAVVNQLRHCNREIENDNNKDIDPNRTHLNFSLTPERNMSDLAYYKQRKEELYCYGRADVKTMAGWIVTAPAELKTREEEITFFKSTYQFLENRYGKENVISATVHYDEGKMEKCKDRWGEYLRDENGEIRKELMLGRPHLHFNFIPVVDDKNARHIQTEKICANDRLNKKELQYFHTDLQKHLEIDGIDAKVITGKTKAQGRNYTVEEMKERYETQKELERLREIEKKYNQVHQRTYREGRW